MTIKIVKWAAASTLLLSSVVAHALPATTNSGYIACLSEQWLEDAVSFVVAKDHQNLQSYLDMKRCITMKEGLRVTVTDGPGMFGGRAEFVYNGFRFWTLREGLNYNP